MRRLWVLLVFLAVLVGAPPATAVEYRLQVANLYYGSFNHFLEGKVGAGVGELVLGRLEAALDAGEVPKGALLYDRTFQAAPPTVAEAFGAAKATGSVVPGGDGTRLWDEVSWEGKPGERSVWVIATSTLHQQEVVHLALKGKDALRYYVPYGVATTSKPAAVVGFPLQFLHFYGERGTLWDRYLSKAVSLPNGIAVVVGVNQNPTFPDWVYIIVEHSSTPTTFKVVVGWDRRRSTDRSNHEGFGGREN